jgi:hypothetical protein
MTVQAKAIAAAFMYAINTNMRNVQLGLKYIF